MEISQFVRDNLKGFVPYNATVPKYKYKMDANETPFKLDKKIAEKIANWILNEENLNLYPDTDSSELREELAKFWGISKNEVMCGVGSDQIIDYIAKVFLNPNDLVVSHTPTFSMYKIATTLNNGTYEEIEFSDDFSDFSDKIIEKAKNAKLIFLCTPNNPTGKEIPFIHIKKILENVKIPVIVDEAYAEFSSSSYVNLIYKYNNLVVLRTFSKAYGIAGVRVGYSIANKNLINSINLVKAPFNLPTLSQKIAIEVLKNGDIYKERVKYLLNQREYVIKELEKYKWIKPYKSETNFIMFESEKEIYDKMLAEGILIRAFKDCKYRVTIGEEVANKLFASVLEKIDKESVD